MEKGLVSFLLFLCCSVLFACAIPVDLEWKLAAVFGWMAFYWALRGAVTSALSEAKDEPKSNVPHTH